MRGAVLISTVLLGLAALTSEARADRLVADLSNEVIKISSNFTGAEIIVFGAIERDILGLIDAARRPGRFSQAFADARRSDIVIVLRGQATQAVVRRKGRRGPIWMNVEAQTFKAAPSFYFVATTRPLADLAASDLLRREEIGLAHLNLQPEARAAPGADPGSFEEALVRNKARQGLYIEDIGGVRMLGDTLFRTTIPIPANVPVSDYYSARAYLLRDGQIVGAQSWRLVVQKTGMERWLYKHAHANSLLYGLGAILLAVLAGLAASAVFRK